jgi:hypothetical protein
VGGGEIKNERGEKSEICSESRGVSEKVEGWFNPNPRLGVP